MSDLTPKENLLTLAMSQPGIFKDIPWSVLSVLLIQELSPHFLYTDTAMDPEVAKRVIVDPNQHMQNIAKKGDPERLYLPVAWRIVWFNEKYPRGVIFPFVIEHDRTTPYKDRTADPDDAKKRIERTRYGYAHCAALVFDGRGRVGIGDKCEDILGHSDYLEKALTGSIGRALVNLGIGTQFAPDIEEGLRIVDSPIASSSHTPPPETDSPLSICTYATKEEALARRKDLLSIIPELQKEAARKYIRMQIDGKGVADRQEDLEVLNTVVLPYLVQWMKQKQLPLPS